MAAGHSPSAPLKNLGYEELHTMEINMQHIYHERMANLFLLLNLRRLRLESLTCRESQAPPDMSWPVAASISGVRTLMLPVRPWT
jgi:hypothetical protein